MRFITALMLLLLTAVVVAATPAGTIIRNQATASYTDADGKRVTVQSNLVETVIEQVAGLQLSADQQLRSVAGRTVQFSHRLRNTGNANDQYQLQLSNSGGSINLNNLQVFADADGNGIADSGAPITLTSLLAPDDELFVVISAELPGSAIDGDSAEILLTAVSQFDNGISQQNTDTVIAGTGASIQLTKSMSASQGLSPSSAYTVTLRYENTGTQAAGDVTLIDALPVGMSYIPGTGRWNESSASLSDNDPADTTAGQGSELRYCAYDASCTGVSESILDTDSDSTNQITAIINFVPPGRVGTLEFDVSIDSDLPGGYIDNQAEFEYDIAITTVPRSLSNVVSFNILPTAGVVANGSTVNPINGISEPVSIFSAAQGGKVTFDNIIWNTGNAVDSFNIEINSASSSFPDGTVWRLLRDDGATLLQDTNGDGFVDTGPIAPGQFFMVVLQLELPTGVSGNNNGIGYDISKTARSINDGSVFDSIIDHLDEIVANQVDITNQAAAGSANAIGVGPGPEALPLSIAQPNNQQVQFELYVRHQGVVPDSYRLLATADTVGTALPAEWLVSFVDADSNQVVTSTRLLASGEAQHITAIVTVPAQLASGTTSIYFEAISDTSGARDIKHDAVQVPAVTLLRLEPSLSAQLEPGGTVSYTHRLSNLGDSVASGITLQSSDSRFDWSSAVYLDTNQNQQFDSADQLANGPFNLAANESQFVFVRVFAPSSAVTLQRNVTTVSVGWNGNPELAQVFDTSTISLSHVDITKEQAIDTGCDGVPDAGQNFTVGEIELAPGNNCVVYRLTALNRGAETSFNVKIHDVTPPYTVYQQAATCSRNPCWLLEPAQNQMGTINAETDQLLPGDSFYLQFSVRLE